MVNREKNSSSYDTQGEAAPLQKIVNGQLYEKISVPFSPGYTYMPVGESSFQDPDTNLISEQPKATTVSPEESTSHEPRFNGMPMDEVERLEMVLLGHEGEGKDLQARLAQARLDRVQRLEQERVAEARRLYREEINRASQQASDDAQQGNLLHSSSMPAFRGEDQEQLQALLAKDGVDAQVGVPQPKSLKQQMGIEDSAEALPLEGSRFGILRNKKVVRVGAVALVGVAIAGAVTLLPKTIEGSNDTAAAVALPDEAKKEIDLQALISDCAPDKIGATVASGTMSVDAGVIWNIPGGKEQFPKLSLGAWDHDNNPATAPANEPRFLPLTANNITISMAVCDPADKPAVTLKDDVLHINFSEVSPQIAFEAGAENAPELSALTQEDLNKLVAKQWMDQEAANTLRRNMTDPNMAIAATKETLHGVVEEMKQPDNKTGIAVVAALKAQLRATIAKQLPTKADGKPYEIVDEGELANGRIAGIGVDVTKNDAYSIDAPRITTQKINEPASKAK